MQDTIVLATVTFYEGTAGKCESCEEWWPEARVVKRSYPGKSTFAAMDQINYSGDESAIVDQIYQRWADEQRRGAVQSVKTQKFCPDCALEMLLAGFHAYNPKTPIEQDIHTIQTLGFAAGIVGHIFSVGLYITAERGPQGLVRPNLIAKHFQPFTLAEILNTVRDGNVAPIPTQRYRV